MTDEPTPLARLAARSEWQGGNRGGVRMATTPPPEIIEEWEIKTEQQPTPYGWPRYDGRTAIESANAARKRLLPKLQDGTIGLHEYVSRVMYEGYLANSMDPAVFDLNGKVRRAYRTSYGERLALQGTIILGVLAGCAIVWTVVWGVM